MQYVNGFDCDGVLTIGIRPTCYDIIITGRSYEEEKETYKWLNKHNIINKVYFNNKIFNDKTRESSGQHKANIINFLLENNVKIINFFEDDEIQAKIIEKECPWVNVIRILHDLTNKENVRRDDNGKEI